MEWKSEDKIFLPLTYEDWKERIQYIKGVIRNIFVEYNVINDVEENIELSDTLFVDFYLDKYKLAIKINDLITRNSSKGFFRYGLYY